MIKKKKRKPSPILQQSAISIVKIKHNRLFVRGNKNFAKPLTNGRFWCVFRGDAARCVSTACRNRYSNS